MKYLTNSLGLSLITFTTLYIITYYLGALATNSPSAKEIIYNLILLAITLTLSSFRFPKRSTYYRPLILLTLAYSSPLLLLYLCKISTLNHLLPATLIFNLALANTLLLLPQLLTYKKLRLPLALVLILLTTIPVIIYFLYYTIYYHLFTVDGLIAILQTNGAEAYSFIHDYAHLSTIITLIISLILIYPLTKLMLIPPAGYAKAPTVLLIAISIFLLILNRTNLLTNPYLDFQDLQNKYGEFINNAPNRYQLIKDNLQQADANTPGIYVLVIGESENKLYTSPFNYKVNSTPWYKEMLDNPNFINFTDAYSCFPQTVQALSYALTLKNQYNDIPLAQAPSILEVAKAAGYKTIWLSNQGKFGIFDTGITLIAKEADYSQWLSSKEAGLSTYVNPQSYDGDLLPLLKKVKLAPHTLIVLHLYGNHGTYKDRFPPQYAKFHGLYSPAVDDYVNSVYYNDQVMEEIYNYVRTLPNFKALIYFSDHGEAVSRGGHSATNYVPVMVTIPMYMYFSNSYIQENPQEFANLKAASHFAYTNDLIANTLFSIMNIRLGNYYEPQNDLGNPDYNHHFQRFRTLYNRLELTDWHQLSPLE